MADPETYGKFYWCIKTDLSKRPRDICPCRQDTGGPNWLSDTFPVSR